MPKKNLPPKLLQLPQNRLLHCLCPSKGLFHAPNMIQAWFFLLLLVLVALQKALIQVFQWVWGFLQLFLVFPLPLPPFFLPLFFLPTFFLQTQSLFPLLYPKFLRLHQATPFFLFLLRFF